MKTIELTTPLKFANALNLNLPIYSSMSGDVYRVGDYTVSDYGYVKYIEAVGIFEDPQQPYQENPSITVEDNFDEALLDSPIVNPMTAIETKLQDLITRIEVLENASNK